MTKTRRWADWLRILGELNRTPEEILSARVDEIEKQLRDVHSQTKERFHEAG